MADVIEVTDQNFQTEVLESDKPTIIDFWAEWCAPCRAIAPIIKELADQYGDRVKIVKLDIDSSPKTPGEYGVRAIPTILAVFGLIIGAIPGLGPPMAIALMIPISFNWEPQTALIMMVSTYAAGIYGGSFTAILLRAPGTSASAATSIEGFEMTKRGKD